jgi:exopolysaccharide biosynthesis polyprenyl glycosylphosphotransferase
MNVRTFAAPLAETPPRRRTLGRALALPVADAAALVLLATAAVASEPAVRVRGGSGSLTVALYVLLGLLAFAAYGLYRPRRAVSEATLGEVGRIAAALAASSWIAFVALDLIGASTLSTGRLAVLGLAAVPAVAGARLAAREYSARTFGPERALVVGAGAVGQQVAARLLTAGKRRLQIVALFDPSPLPTQDERLGNLPVFDNVHDFERALEQSGATRVIFAFSQINVPETLDLVRICDRRGVDVDVVPRLFELFANGVSLDSAEGIPLLSLPSVRPPAYEVAAKRVFDVVTAAVLLVLLAPLLLLIALVVRLDSPGPAIYRQARVGRNGRIFRMAKFRTMEKDADERAEWLLAKQETPPGIKPSDDPRRTRFGRLLRITSMDELPQLWNVLRGEMSLVGPRPLPVYEFQGLDGGGATRLDVLPGLTGLWQVLGRSEIPFDERMRLDYLYARNRSLGWDFRLIARTVSAVIRRRGAY